MNDAVSAFKAPGSFDLDKYLIGIAYPTEEVVLFTDAHAVNELLKLRRERALIEERISKQILSDREAARTEARTVGDPEPKFDSDTVVLELEELQAKIDEWDAKVAENPLVIELRGMPPYIVDEITSKHFIDKTVDYSGTDEETARDYELISRSIVSINGSTNAVDVDDVKKIRGSVLSDEYYKLVTGVAHVNLNGALFDQATDASFLSRRTHVAGK